MTLIKIKGYRYSIDWVYEETKEVETNDIIGFEIHWRLDTWHIVVRTKEKLAEGYYSYDIAHWVDWAEVRKLIMNKEAKILKIVNYHQSDNFTKNLIDLFKPIKGDLHVEA